VPQCFKISYIVPILKPKKCMSKYLSYDDFRGIAISPIISKICEYCFWDKFESLLSSSDNQFGFKKDRVSEMQFTLFERLLIAMSHEVQLHANICTIDLSKAFDKVNHHALYIKLINRLFPYSY